MNRRIRWLAAAVGGLAVMATTAVPAAAARSAGADELAAGESYMRAYMDRVRAPGLAWAVVRGGEVLRQGAWGVDGDRRPITAETPFLLGSTSKSFTALAVAQLAEGGRVGLDTAAAVYLPWLRLGDADAAPAVTVRQLLTHTSGLPQVWSTGLTDRYDNRPGGLAASVRDLAGLRPGGAAGQSYEYSDANYMILGALVESVSGDSFGGYLRRHVLDPLRMNRSAATAGEARAVGVPAGHRYYLGRPQRFAALFDTAGVPYGFLAASLGDMSRYAIAQLGGGLPGGTRILSAAGMAQMHRGTADTGHGTYGFGWQNSTLDGVGVPMVWHAGATPDYFTHVVLLPGSDLAVVVMANVYGLTMDAPLSAGAFNLTRILHGGTPVAAAEDPMHWWVLAGLLGIVVVLLVVLGWSVLGGSGPRGRTVAATAAWSAGCATVVAGAAWVVPSFWKGAGLSKLQLWAPDVGHAVAAVIVVAGALAVIRLGVGVRALVTRGTAHGLPAAGVVVKRRR